MQFATLVPLLILPTFVKLVKKLSSQCQSNVVLITLDHLPPKKKRKGEFYKFMIPQVAVQAYIISLASLVYNALVFVKVT